MAGIDRYAIAIRIDQLEVVVTKELVLTVGYIVTLWLPRSFGRMLGAVQGIMGAAV